MIRLAAPMLFAAGAPVVLWVLFRLRRLPRGLVGARRRLVQALILLATLCAWGAAGGVEFGRKLDRQAVIVVLDRSRSVGEAGDARFAEVQRTMREIPERDLAGLVVVADGAATERAPAERPDIAQLQASVPREETDLEAGLRRALADLPDGYNGRIVLISDGRETRGDLLAAATAAAARGVPVDVVPIDREPQPEISVASVRAPRRASRGDPVEVRVVTRSATATPARLTLLRDGRPIASADVDLRAGEDVLVVRDLAEGNGLRHYEARLEPLEDGYDASSINNRAGAFTRIVGPSRGLVVASEPAEAQALADAMGQGGREVELVDPSHMPLSLSGFAGYDFIVLSDVPARALGEQQMALLASYVRDMGGGLLMVGAHRAFGLGGYAYTPIEEVLPATFDLRRRRDRMSLAMVIGIDNSGSMGAMVSGGRTKLDLANEAAARSSLLLSPNDRVGVMHVDTQVGWTQPMTTVQSPEAIATRVRAAQPGGGGIYVDITLEAAYQALRSEQTQLRHFLLFSDGNDSEEMSRAESLVRQATADDITTSVVSMGNGPDTPALERLSSIGGGRFYIVEDLTELPRVFTQETIEASRSVLHREPTPVSLGEPGPPTRGIDWDAAPPLDGYVVVNARPRSTVLLGAGERDALLLTWQHGLGRGAVFASDAGARYSKPWLTFAGYRQLFGQLGRDIARPESDPNGLGGDVRVSVDRGRGRVVFEAVGRDGELLNHLRLRAQVAAPRGESQAVELEQTGAGRYEADFDASAPGAYLVTIGDDQDRLLGTAGATRLAGAELRGEGTNLPLLAQLAASTGGQVRAHLAEPFADRPPAIRAFQSLAQWLMMAALVLMLLSVAARRLVLPKLRPRRATIDREVDPATAEALLTHKRTQREQASSGPAVAAEVLVARRAEADADGAPPASPSVTTAAEPTGADEQVAGEAGAAPSSLAEQLLARKKKR